ncbi:ketopantoate hydroxymethyltransferase [Paenibacillus sp. Z6-24]
MIQNSYLQEIASYTNQRIAKVTLNGEYEITQFRIKQVTDDLVELEYLIPAVDLSSVTRLELRSVSDEIISSSEVFIPVAADTVVKQYVEVKGA